MNITKQTPQQVKKDEAAHKAKDSMLRIEQDQHQEKKQRIKKRQSDVTHAKKKKQEQIQKEQKTPQKLEVAVQQVLLQNVQQGVVSSYDQQFVLLQGGEISLPATLQDRQNTEDGASPKTVYTARQQTIASQVPFSSSRQQLLNYGNNNNDQGLLGNQSTHTLDEQDQRNTETQGSQPNLHMNYIDKSERRIDPMRTLQTKQNNNSPPNRKTSKRKNAVEQKPSIIEIIPPRGHYNSGSIKAGRSSNQSIKNYRRSSNNSSNHSPNQSPRTPKVPNLDIIEDVSRASQVFPHELHQTHSASMHTHMAIDQQNMHFVAIVDPYTASNSPLAPPVNTAFAQNTTVGFHRGGANLQYVMNATASSLLEASTSKPRLSPKKSNLTITKAAKAQIPVAYLAATVSDEDKFKNDRTGISKNSFERASKQYYLHQQKMLIKEQERRRMQEKDAIIQARSRFRNKSMLDSSAEQTQTVHTITQTDILLDQPQTDGNPGIIVRRSSRDSDNGSASPTSRSPAENRNIEFTPNLSRASGDKRNKGTKITPSPPAGGRDSVTNNGELSALRMQRMAATNRFGGSKIQRTQREGSDLGDMKSSQMRVALELKTQTISSSILSANQQYQFQQPVKSTKFFQTTNKFEDQQQTMVIGRQVVPIVSKMRQVNLLNPQNSTTQSPKTKNQTVNNFHHASQHSRRGSQPPVHPDHEIAESSVKTIFDSPNIRLVPRPLNFVYQIQQERELQQLNTADCVYSIESQTSPMANKAHYSNDEQINEEQYGVVNLENDILGGTLKFRDETNPSIAVGFEKDLTGKQRSRRNSARRAGGEQGKEGRKNSAKNKQNGLKKKPSEINADAFGGIHGLQNDSRKVIQQSRTKIKLKKSKHDVNDQIAQHPDRNNEAGSRFSNVMTLKPPSPGTPQDYPEMALNQIVIEKDFEGSRNGTAETHQLISIESKRRQPNNILVSSSESISQFIELPDNPYLQPNYLQEYMQDAQVHSAVKNDAMRQQDPETYLYLVLLKKMQHNPNANVTKELQKIMVSDQQEDFGQLKPLLYRKWKKRDLSKDQFKKEGVIEEESFQFDELKRKRTEFMNYCLKKIHSAIHDEPMKEKDQKKSPLNVQISNSQRRKTQRNLLSDLLKTEYGITFREDPSKTEKLVNGVSTVDLQKDKPGIFGLQTPEQIRNFEELNGIKITPQPSFNTRNLNDNSILGQDMNTRTLGLLPKLSQTTWYDQEHGLQKSPQNEVKYDEDSPLKLPMAANTNFDFQPNLAARADLDLTRREKLLQPLHLNYASSGELNSTERDNISKQHMMTTSQGFGLSLKESKSVAHGTNMNQQNIFKKRFRSLQPSATGQFTGQIDQIMTLDQTNSRLTFDHGPRSIAQAHSTTNRSRSKNHGMINFFSSHQRFETLFMENGGQTFQRDQVSKHSNPKFIEIIAKMRDPSLNTEYMLKTSIRPKVIEKQKVRKLNQSAIDKHINKNTLDNQGCPLLPIHKMDPIYHQQMLSQLKSQCPRPMEKNWQQLNVMLPILRQNHTTNILKNDQVMVIDPKQENRCKRRVVENTMHTQADLTAPSIFQQTNKAKRYNSVIRGHDSHEHRIKVKDIIAVKKNNERELFEKRWQSRKDIETKARHDTSKTNQELADEIDIMAEQMVQEEVEQALWTANSY